MGTTERLYQPMEGRKNQGGGRAQEAQRQTGQEERNQGRTGKGPGDEKERRGGKDQKGRGEEKEDGRSRNQETRNDGSPERKGWQVFSPCYGCSQGAIQVQRTS